MTSPVQPPSEIGRPAPVPARRRGRPRAFDRDAALDRALGLFWTQGFEGTSIADLTEALDINPPSLYAAFGSKEELFREVLNLYIRAYGLPLEQALTEERTTLDAVARILRAAARLFPAGSTPGGCMICNGGLTWAPPHRSVANVVAGTRDLMVSALGGRIMAGKAMGEIPGDFDPLTLARFVAAVIEGMAVQARDGADEATLLGIADVALRAWPARSRAR